MAAPSPDSGRTANMSTRLKKCHQETWRRDRELCFARESIPHQGTSSRQAENSAALFLYGQYCQRWRSGALFALLHEAGFCGTRKRLAILAHRFGCASLLCEGGTTSKCYDECSEHYFPEHGSLPSMVIAIEFDPSRLFQARLKIQFRKARRLARIANGGSIS